MVVKRVGVLSVGRIACLLYGVVGILAGLLLAGIAPLMRDQPGAESLGPFFPLLFGAGAIVFLPILYSVIGFVVGVVLAAVYNGVARWTGGVEIELAPDPAKRL
jgi:hypothetical protein